MVGSTRNPGLPARIARNPPGILVFLVGLLGFLQEYMGQGKVLSFSFLLCTAVDTRTICVDYDSCYTHRPLVCAQTSSIQYKYLYLGLCISLAYYCWFSLEYSELYLAPRIPGGIPAILPGRQEFLGDSWQSYQEDQDSW